MLKNAKIFVKNFKIYASYIHTSSLNDNNFRKSGKKGNKTEKKLTFTSSLLEVINKYFAKPTGKHLCQTEAVLQKCFGENMF